MKPSGSSARCGPRGTLPHRVVRATTDLQATDGAALLPKRATRRVRIPVSCVWYRTASSSPHAGEHRAGRATGPLGGGCKSVATISRPCDAVTERPVSEEMAFQGTASRACAYATNVRNGSSHLNVVAGGKVAGSFPRCDGPAKGLLARLGSWAIRHASVRRSNHRAQRLAQFSGGHVVM